MYDKVRVGAASARKFSNRILTSVRQLGQFPYMGVLKEERLLGRYGYRAIFIDQYACIYHIDGDAVYVYHLADARTNYQMCRKAPAFRHGECQIFHIFGIEPYGPD